MLKILNPFQIKCSVAIFSIALWFFSSFLPNTGWAQQRFITIGTGGVTGVYYAAGGAMCRLVNKDRAQHGTHCTVEPTGGSIFNVNALRAKELDFAVVQSDVGYNAYRGEQQFTQPFNTLRSVFSIHPEPITVVVNPKSGIDSFEQLAGKRFNVGNPGSGSRASFEQLLTAMNLDLSYFSLASELRSGEHGKALCDDKIDGFVYSVGHPSVNIQEPVNTCGAKIIPLEGQVIDALVEQNPYYALVEIAGGLYAQNPDDVATYGVLATLLTREDVSDEEVYHLVSGVFENFEDFKRLHPAFAHLQKEQIVTDGLTAPLHPGAERYFKEVGLLD